MADRVIVMYAGHVVEDGPDRAGAGRSPATPTPSSFCRPYPTPGRRSSDCSSSDAGEPPKVVNPSAGCRFEPRCPFAIEQCRNTTPALGEVAPAQLAACHVALAQATGKARVPVPS